MGHRPRQGGRERDQARSRGFTIDVFGDGAGDFIEGAQARPRSAEFLE